MIGASDLEAGDRLGTSVAIDGSTAIVGSPGNSDDGTYSGSAYIVTPEPATLGLVLIGGLALLRRRRK